MAIITMTDQEERSLLRLLTWLSPAFPVGSFAYSHGMERAIHDGVILDRASLADWLHDLLAHGSAWNDAVILAASWREADSGGDCGELAELAAAMASSRERHMETTLQGAAFTEAAAAWGEAHAGALPYPVAVGLTAGRHGIALEKALTAYLHAFVSNLVQASVRLVPLGQRDGVAVIAGLETALLDTAARAAASTIDDLGSASIRSDIMSMKHEVQYSRVFRS
ncbi:MAG: urease accessory protein UreF [Rhizobiaceae bacterium]|nr:urease accessory protein UreF [Rhizobiaceae bacterium]